ncbi:MAG: histidinol-phosphate transaminase [Leptolyngbya sp. SIO1D8]|nr:histidinol-phosphate transaminase [Leptolyngbya sp. SIO1D8]
MPEFIRPDLLEFAAYSAHPKTETTYSPESIDSLDTNECAYDLPSTLKEKLAWQYQQSIAANRYPDGSHHELKAAIAHYATTSAALTAQTITAEQVSVGNGSDELIRSLLIATCVGRSGAILVASPTFSMYSILAQTLGISVVSVGRNEETFEVDLEAAQTAIESNPEPIRLVFMVSPNSPTGNSLTAAELTWLRALPQDVLVVVDEAYFEFSQQTTVIDAITRSNWVVTRTFSKAFRLAAHRVGYALSSPGIIQVLEKVRLPYNLPSFSQTAAHLALAHSSNLIDIIAEVQTERDRLSVQLGSLPGLRVWPSVANFLYCRPTQSSIDTVFYHLQNQGTYIRQTGGGLRITIGSPQENNRTLLHFEHTLTMC